MYMFLLWHLPFLAGGSNPAAVVVYKCTQNQLLLFWVSSHCTIWSPAHIISDFFTCFGPVRGEPTSIFQLWKCTFYFLPNFLMIGILIFKSILCFLETGFVESISLFCWWYTILISIGNTAEIMCPCLSYRKGYNRSNKLSLITVT